jgi:LPXTG-motif cell wall-anchored protein
VLGVNTFTNGSFQFNTGVYTVTEQSTILGYTLTSVGGICSDLLLPNSATLTVSQQGGQCIFTNTRDTGSVKVNKLLDADGNGVFETTNPKSFTWSLDNVGQNEMGTVLNNVFTNTPSLNHVVSESTLSDYHFVGWYLITDSEYSCANPQGTQLPIDITVLKNQTTELTLCNSRDTGTLKVSKQLDSNGDGTFETNNPSQFTWSYDDSSQKIMGESISNLPTGKYNLYENNVDNYNFVGWFNQSGEGSCNDLDGTQLPVNVDVLKDKETEIVFCNEVQKPKLTVTKIVDGGEAQVSDFQLFVGEQQVVSGETNDFVVGQYVVSETNIDGYTGTFSGDCNLEGEVELDPGDEKTCILTNLRDTGSLTVIKDVLDPNGNPIEDNSSEFSVSLNGNEAKLISEETSVTYENLPTGQFDLVELENEDYIFDSYSLDADSEKEGAQVAVTKGQNTVLTVYNRQKFGKIVVHKEVVDSQGNYDAQSDEEFDVILSMDDESEVLGKISDNGEESLTAAFENLVPSNYTFTEVPKVGFEFVGCYLNEQENVQRLDNDTNINTVIASNEIEHWTCVNRAIDAQLALEKTNNKTGIDQIAGNTVRYTLTVQAPMQEEITLTKLAELDTEQFILNDVKVIDLAPQGFEYINGSWSAVSSVRGDLKDLLVTPQPNYSSFGTWELGTMLEGEKVTLSYEAKIANSQDAGLYKDLAWTQATDVVGERIIGSAEFGSFAGTQVTVVDPVEDGVAQVLGVSLPNTGSNLLWIALSIFSVLSGLTMLFFAGRRRKNLFVIPVIMFIGILSFFSPTNIYADSGLNLRVEQPKSIFNKKDMKLGFVALDINNREISITCEKKGPSDSGFVAFGSTIALPNGGGNGDCTLNSSLLTSNGSYQFKVNAIAGSDSATEIVNMTLDTDKPASVLNYSKNKVACTNVITFRTSGDGQTQKIQIFRSTNTTFNANSETLVYESAATPNQNIEYIDTLPNCNIDYYYAVRAVDGANNSSLFVADSIAIVIDNDTTPNDDDGNVQGVDDNDGNGNGTTDGETPKPDEDGNGEVKGEEIENDPDKTLGVTNTSWNYIIGIILAAALLWILERTGILQAIFQKIGSLRRR